MPTSACATSIRILRAASLGSPTLIGRRAIPRQVTYSYTIAQPSPGLQRSKHRFRCRVARPKSLPHLKPQKKPCTCDLFC
eukprot:959161-Pleurochrysis_carterae.AAC.1